MQELVLSADADNLHRVFDFFLSHLRTIGCGEEMLGECKLCIEEIYLNIASYAYKKGKGDVKVTIDIDDAASPVKLIFSFIDSGTPYNPLLNEDPDIDATVEERKVGGLGVFLVKELMDEVKYEYKDGKNVFTMMMDFK